MRVADHRINEAIMADEVRLVLPSGEHRITSLKDALDCVEQAGLDLVEVSPSADPPVCRVIDYDKYRFLQAKKARRAHPSRGKTAIKETKLRPKTSDHHREFKARDTRRWLQAGHRVRVSVIFQGREKAYPEIGQRLLDRLAAELEDVSTVSQTPRMNGDTMDMVLAPRKNPTAR